MDETEIYTREAESSATPVEFKHARISTQRNKKWKWLFILFLLVLLSIMLLIRKGNLQLIILEGQGLGRDYKIQYRVAGNINYQDEVEKLLMELEQVVDSRLKDSEVAKFNHYTCEPFHYNSPFFYPLLAKSKEVYNNTQGAFDPTVAPLIKLWKKNLRKGIEPNYLEIQSLREYIGLDYIVVNEKRVKKLKEGIKIDLSSIITGYGVDLILDFLRSKDVKDVCIELGNKARSLGVNSNKHSWEVSHHLTDGRVIINPFSVTTKLTAKGYAIARRHTPLEREQNMRIVIDPKTGYPPTGNIIAAFVFADDCITASAYATAIIVRNFTDALEILKETDKLDVFLIYTNDLEEIAFYNSQGLKVSYSEDSQEIKIETAL
jgi:thiamine biosynthesis lipoprotein